jgi:DnaK suppressor protein
MDESRARELLAGERERVERALARADDEDEATDPAEADPGTEMVGEELEDELAERLREELEAIDRAEKRLEQGTYGLSVESGRPIPDARLETIPWAERTADEQERYERSG